MTAERTDGAERPSLEAQIQAASQASEGLSAMLRVRVSPAVEVDLGRIEAFFQGGGWRHVNRSHLVRVALKHLIDDLYEEHPAINTPTFLETISGSEKTD